MAICWKEWHSGATRDTIIQQADFLAQKWTGIGQVLSSQNLLDLCPPLKKKFQLEANCFEIFCWFLATHQHDQPHTYVPSLLNLAPTSHPILPLLVDTRALYLSSLPHIADSHWLISYMAVCMFHCSRFVLPSASPPWVHSSVLYICISCVLLSRPKAMTYVDTSSSLLMIAMPC